MIQNTYELHLIHYSYIFYATWTDKSENETVLSLSLWQQTTEPQPILSFQTGGDTFCMILLNSEYVNKARAAGES